MAAVLNKEPEPLTGLVPDLPKELDRIVARCLRKDLARRSQSMAEIKIALEELKEETDSGVSASAAAAKKRPSRWRWTALGGAAVAFGAVLFFFLPRQADVPLKEVPLTSYPGYQGEPTLSPDGNQFAFIWDGGQENPLRQLYVSLVGRGTPLRLANTPGTSARYPAWSPDGQMIAFVRFTPGRSLSGLGPVALGDLIVIPALGGPERRIDQATATRPAWSPDGNWLYYSAYRSPQTRAIYVQASAGGERRQITNPPDETYGDGELSVSPDGRQLVFVRSFANFNADLFVADLHGANAAGTPRRLTNDHREAFSPVWTAGGEEIIYISGESTSLLGIYRVRTGGGRPRRVQGIGGDYAQLLALAPKRQRLVYSRSYRDFNIYRMPLPAPGGSAGPAVKFLSSTRFEESPTYSPDGKRIAFSSNREGVRQIWVADADGSNSEALTSFPGGVAGSPKWSPDGQTILFDARPEGLADVYSISAHGGTPKRLTDNPAEDHVPCYSADGRWIYFASTRSGQRQLYRIPATGGDAVQITRGGAFVSAASPDGKWIYFSKVGGAISKIRVDGGEETAVLSPGSISSPFGFGVGASGIYFAGILEPASRTWPLKLYRFADGKTVDIGRFEKPVRLHLSISPDEKWLIYSQLDSSTDDLMLVENFR